MRVRAMNRYDFLALALALLIALLIVLAGAH